jgi:hypothetical protein
MNEEITIEIEEEELIYDIYTKEEFYERELGRYMDRIAAEKD